MQMLKNEVADFDKRFKDDLFWQVAKKAYSEIDESGCFCIQLTPASWAVALFCVKHEELEEKASDVVRYLDHLFKKGDKVVNYVIDPLHDLYDSCT